MANAAIVGTVFARGRSGAARCINETLPVAQRYHLELLPEPFLGVITSAPVVFLYMNPAYSETELRYHEDAGFRAKVLRNLHHEPLPCPFYFLEPTADQSPGHNGYRAALNNE